MVVEGSYEPAFSRRLWCGNLLQEAAILKPLHRGTVGQAALDAQQVQHAAAFTGLVVKPCSPPVARDLHREAAVRANRNWGSVDSSWLGWPNPQSQRAVSASTNRCRNAGSRGDRPAQFGLRLGSNRKGDIHVLLKAQGMRQHDQLCQISAQPSARPGWQRNGSDRQSPDSPSCATSAELLPNAGNVRRRGGKHPRKLFIRGRLARFGRNAVDQICDRQSAALRHSCAIRRLHAATSRSSAARWLNRSAAACMPICSRRSAT